MSQTEPGWYYADGDPPGTMRYWDGAQWVGEPTSQTPTSDGPNRSGILPEPGTLLPEAWKAVRTQLGPLLGLFVGMLIAIIVVYAIGAAALFSQADLDALNDPGDFLAQSIVAVLILGFLVGIIQSVYSLTTSRLLQLHYRHRNPSLDAAWTKAKQRLWPFFGTAVALYIGVYIAIAIIAIVLSQIHGIALLLLIPVYLFVVTKLGFLPIAAVATERGQSMVHASTSVSAGDRFFPALGRVLLSALPFIAVNVIGVLIGQANGGLGLVVFLVGGTLAALVFQSAMVKIYVDVAATSDI